MDNRRHAHLGSAIASCASALLPCSSAPAYAQCNVALVRGACRAAPWVVGRQCWPCTRGPPPWTGERHVLLRRYWKAGFVVGVGALQGMAPSGAPHVNRILPLRCDCKDCANASLNASSG